MPLPAGTRLGHYEITAHLGAGAMGEVYRARDSRLKRDAALKLLPPELAQDPDRLRRFELEARAASALNHPAIVTVYELGHTGDEPFISMELVEGTSLRAVLEKGAMPLRRALQIAAQIADGLAKAHEAGIIHRDLKPENLIVSTDGFVKILDFGLAKVLVAQPAPATESTLAGSTLPGVVLGTVGYMAPEQVRGEPAGPQADQFALGVVLYEMLTGRRPFDRGTMVETMSAIVAEEPEPLHRVKPDVPVPVRWLVERCLAKSPAERYASTRDLAHDLATARDRLSEVSAGGVASLAPARASARREQIAWLLVAALAVLVATLLVARSRDAGPEPLHTVRFSVAAPPDGTILSSGVQGSPLAVSPDGRFVAFAASGGGAGRRLWLRSLDALDLRPLPGSEGALQPFWSPDSRSIGFFAGGQLRRLAVDGGGAVAVCDAPGGGGGAAWNEENVILFSPNLEGSLLRVPAAGGIPVPVTSLDPALEESAHAWPVFLPGGKRFIFQVLGTKPGIYVGSFDSTERTLLVPGGEFERGLSTLGFSLPNYILFARNGTLLAQALDLDRLQMTGDAFRVADGIEHRGPAGAFSVSLNGVLAYWAGQSVITELTWMDRAGRQLGTVGARGTHLHVHLAADGRRAAITRSDGTGVWLLDLERATSSRISTGGDGFSGLLSPDGNRLVFSQARDTPPNLYLRELDTSGTQSRLLRHRNQSFPTGWSPDGRFIVFDVVSPATQGDLWLLPSDGSGSPKLFLQTPANETQGRVSPDGRWMAYASDESGRFEVYVTTFPEAGQRWLVSTSGGAYPVWGPDGRELFYLAADRTLVAVPVLAGPRFEPGRPVPLFTVDIPAVIGRGIGMPFDVAADGRFLVTRLVERQSPPLTIVMSWLRGAGR